jgi:hypothetical protein
VLAVFDGQRLQTYAAGRARSLAGYGGDIAPAGGGFAVSCPRANGVALWRADGQWARLFAAAGSLRAGGGGAEKNEDPACGLPAGWQRSRRTAAALSARPR